MCLDTVDREISVNEGVGYKAFHRNGEQLCGMYYGKNLVQGKWITDSNTIRIGKRYPAGYHIYLSKGSAELNKILSNDIIVRKCWFKGVVATGSQYCEAIVVARQIKINKRDEK